MQKPLRIAINGFGRIGRLVFRLGFGDPDFEFVAINDLGDAANLVYLLKHDTVYRTYQKNVMLEIGNESVGKATSMAKLSVDGKKIHIFQEKDPLNLPWGELGIDLVIESTGVFESFEKSQVHIQAGARRVLLAAAAKDEDSETSKTVLLGVNEGELKACQMSAHGSCTTNATHSVIQILHEAIGIKKAIVNTVHAYTAIQSIVDGPTRKSDWRGGRAAAANIVPFITGAATTVTKAVKELAGKFDGLAFRVPVAAGSIAAITFVASRPTTVDEVNNFLVEASKHPRWNKILAVTNEQLVSSDIVGMEYGAIVDLAFTKVIDKDLVEVVSWYDNEMGYTRTLIEHARAIKAVINE